MVKLLKDTLPLKIKKTKGCNSSKIVYKKIGNVMDGHIGQKDQEDYEKARRS